MANYRGLNGNRLEQISESLETSEELLNAIEQIANCDFEYEEKDGIEEIACNAAYALWEDGGRDEEIMAALPVDCAEEDEVFWGANGKFAEFDGEKWVKA